MTSPTLYRLLALSLLVPLLLLLSACGSQPSVLAHYGAPPPVKPMPIKVEPVALPDEVMPLLVYHQSLRRMTQGELLKELSGLLQQQRTPKVTLQTGMILMLTRGGGDLARAQGLFDGVAASNDPGSQGLRAFAQLLGSHCAEARRLYDQADRLSVQLKDTTKRTEQLSDTVEALKAIERGLPVRPANGANGAAAPGGR
ncbi:hypothetical protein [Massilia sp. METH4]|uniref:hypothetical protein n=1 Tax=Massilia sp. METH4 TaxID=3123041 RepID=UPI0030CC6565